MNGLLAGANRGRTEDILGGIGGLVPECVPPLRRHCAGLRSVWSRKAGVSQAGAGSHGQGQEAEVGKARPDGAEWPPHAAAAGAV